MEENVSRIFLGNNDLDSTGVYILLHYYQIPYTEAYLTDYDFFENETHMNYVMTYDEIYFVDFAPSKWMLDEMIDRKKHFYVYDHHEPGWEILKDLPESNLYEIHVDFERSGTEIFYDEFIKPTLTRTKPIVEYFVEMVSGYDLWKKDQPIWNDGLNLNRVLYGSMNYGQSEFALIETFVRNQTSKLQMSNEWFWTEKEQKLIKRAEEREAQMKALAEENLSVRTDSKGKKFGVTALPSKISLGANYLLEQYEDLEYVIAINTWGGGINGKLSFRSRGDFNCNELSCAEGHDAAAGGHIQVDEALKLYNGDITAISYLDEFDSNDSSSRFYIDD